MNTKLFKRGSVRGSALVISSVMNIVLCGSLVFSAQTVRDSKYELNKAREEIVQHEKSLKNQNNVIGDLKKDQMDLKSKNDKLLKDNAKLNLKLKSGAEQYAQLQQMLKQTKLQASRKK